MGRELRHGLRALRPSYRMPGALLAKTEVPGTSPCASFPKVRGRMRRGLPRDPAVPGRDAWKGVPGTSRISRVQGKSLTLRSECPHADEASACRRLLVALAACDDVLDADTRRVADRNEPLPDGCGE
jgi:hypothetical protein